MAETKHVVEIRNETALDIAISGCGTLKPLEVGRYEPRNPILSFTVPGMGARFMFLAKEELPPLVTIDLATVLSRQRFPVTAQEFCERLPSLREQGSAAHLRVTNETSHLACVWLLDGTGGRLMGAIGPGETWGHPSEPFLMWHFRTQGGLTLGMFVHPQSGEAAPVRAMLTTSFLDAWRAYQRPPAAPGQGGRGLAPLTLLGERRARTPGPDDQQFISASTVRLDLSKEPFNGLENRVVRDVEIAGPVLRWSGSNRILASYYGEHNAADIRSLTIVCDRMEVSDHLHFPRTHVTIHARELVFTGIGRIDTTPLPYPGRAESTYLVEDPHDQGDPDQRARPKVPADEDGKPTYRAADGRKGEPGGSITLFVREASYVDDGRRGRWHGDPGIRLVTRGGKGQQGEAGGLKAYVPGPGQPLRYGPLPVVTPDMLARTFEDKSKDAFGVVTTLCSDYHWPGGVDGPSLIAGWAASGAYGPSAQVTSVSLFAMGRSGNLRKLYLPTYQYWNEPMTDAGWIDVNSVSRGCRGRDAYPGGWPGEGGDGGAVNLISERDLGFAADRRAGEMGDPTLPVEGDKVAQEPVHLRIDIYPKWSAYSTRPPGISVSSRGGGRGQSAAGRAAQPAEEDPRADTYPHRESGYVVDRQGRIFDTRPNAGTPGRVEFTRCSDLSWAHPAAMAAVLSYARTAFRNGFRDEAARALGPYRAVALAQADTIARCGTDVQLAFASMAALFDKLALDVDYCGNPPGWVPRLNALSNLAALKTVRDAAYGTYYFADRMLRDAEALEDMRETAVQATQALAAEMIAARTQLQRAYEQLPAAMVRLNEVQKKVVGVEEEILALRKEAIARSADKVLVQRVVSAALQMVDGIAKALPVGQPFVGLAGSVFGAAAKIDWNAEKPLETAGAAIAHLSDQVTTFVTEKGDAVATAVTGHLRGQAATTEALVTRLTREEEDAAKGPAEAVTAVEVTWQECKSGELLRLEEQIKKTNEAIQVIKTAAKDGADPDLQAGNAFLDALSKQRDVLARKQLAPLQRELVEYRKQQFELINRAQLVAKAKNEALKEQAARTPTADLPPSVADKLAAATRQSEDQQALVARREATAKETMANLQGLGTGLAAVGNAIVTMATPVSAEDPTVQRLADEMLVNDPALREAGQRFASRLKGLLEDKREAAATLLLWQQQATTSLATVTRNLATVSELSKQRQSIDMGLSPAAKAYLKETRDAAKDALAESIYWFVKSYQYEFLEDVSDSFFNFDTWATALHTQEATKLAQAAPAPAPAAGRGAVVTRAARVLLSKEDFDSIGDEVFKAEQLKLGKSLLERRQKRGPSTVAEYVACVLQRTIRPKDPWERRQNEMLEALGQGEVVFDFVRDFAKGSYDWNNARVAQIRVVKLDIDASDPNLSLTFRVQQRGEMVLASRTGGERQFYVFRPGRDDDPVGWTFVYNHPQRKTSSGITVPTVADPLGDVAKGMLNANLTFQEYQPALFSDYVIRITDLYGVDGRRKGLEAITALTMNVFLSEG